MSNEITETVKRKKKNESILSGSSNSEKVDQ